MSLFVNPRDEMRILLAEALNRFKTKAEVAARLKVTVRTLHLWTCINCLIIRTPTSAHLQAFRVLVKPRPSFVSFNMNWNWTLSGGGTSAMRPDPGGPYQVPIATFDAGLRSISEFILEEAADRWIGAPTYLLVDSMPEKEVKLRNWVNAKEKYKIARGPGFEEAVKATLIEVYRRKGVLK